MDDPWGSPWADEGQDQPHLKELEEGIVDGSLTTGVKETAKALKVNTWSPWDNGDDNGFGEWEEDAGGEARREELHLSSQWNDLGAEMVQEPPSLSPNLLVEKKDIVRQASPDPWATETAFRSERSDEKEKKTVYVPEDEDKQEEMLFARFEDKSTVKAEGESATTELEHKKEGSTTEKEVAETNNLVDIPPTEEMDGLEEGSVLPSVETEDQKEAADPEFSRPSSSSSPSDRSNQGEVQQESPRTSLDEEPKRVEHISRGSSKVRELVKSFNAPEQNGIEPTSRGSSKVRDLVEHFDGLAKPEVVPELGAHTRKADEEEDEEADEDDFGDFGEFEEGISDTGGIGPEILKSSDDRPILPSDGELRKTTKEGSLKSSGTLKPKDRHLGHVDFAVDNSALNDLFSGAETSSEPPAEKAYIPDTIIRDSFSTTDERKTWYRISRDGTLRKHNTGDDENYVGISWQHSTVRDKTLEIVARWMGEDRISGRVVLGGKSKGDSVFGWDSNAAPASLSSALAAKRDSQPLQAQGIPGPVVDVPREWPKGLVRERSRSRGRSHSKSRRESLSKSAMLATSAKLEPPQAPVASFGWSSKSVEQSVPVSKQEQPSQALAFGMSMSPVRRPGHSTNRKSSLSTVTLPGIADRPEPTAPPALNSFPGLISEAPAAMATEATQTEDDEWGDMISSPPIDPTPIFAEPQSFHHQSTVPIPHLPSDTTKRAPSVSFDEIFGSKPTITPIPSSASHPLQRPTRNRAPSTSFDEILSPNPATHATPTSAATAPQRPTTRTRAPSVTFDEILSSKPHSPGTPNTYSLPTHNSPLRHTAFPSTSNSIHNNNQNLISGYPTPPLTGQIANPWHSADFSFFDSASVVASPEMPALSLQKSVGSVSKASPNPEHKTREELEQDRIVEGIVRGLPDLGYMFRR